MTDNPELPTTTTSSSTSANDHALQGQFQRLRSLFKDSDYSTHPEHWDTLWKESFTPWDRGGPSQALDEVLSLHRDLFPSAPNSSDDWDKPRPKALVAGCGRGHDALLLSAHGYDVFGLDSSPTSLEEAKKNEKRVAEENTELYAPRRELGVTTKGRVMWVAGDFFENDWVNDSGYGKVKNGFDLIFDYEVCVLASLKAFLPGFKVICSSNADWDSTASSFAPFHLKHVHNTPRECPISSTPTAEDWSASSGHSTRTPQPAARLGVFRATCILPILGIRGRNCPTTTRDG